MSASISLRLLAGASLLAAASNAAAQSLDACELDLDLLGTTIDEECDLEGRSAGWARFGFDPAGMGLLTAGAVAATLAVLPGSGPEVRVARLQPTQPVVWLSTQDTRAALIPDEWIDVVLVRPTPETRALALVHWQLQGLSVNLTTLAQSPAVAASGPLDLTIGWTYAAGQATITVAGLGNVTLSATRSSFGTALPWLSLPHFPLPIADFGSATLASVSGSVP